MDIALKNYSLSFETKKFFNDELLLKKNCQSNINCLNQTRDFH